MPILIQVRELDSHSKPLEEAGVVLGRAGKTNPEMANHLSVTCPDALQDFDVKAVFSCEVAEGR